MWSLILQNAIIFFPMSTKHQHKSIPLTCTWQSLKSNIAPQYPPQNPIYLKTTKDLGPHSSNRYHRVLTHLILHIRLSGRRHFSREFLKFYSCIVISWANPAFAPAANKQSHAAFANARKIAYDFPPIHLFFNWRRDK